MQEKSVTENNIENKITFVNYKTHKHQLKIWFGIQTPVLKAGFKISDIQVQLKMGLKNSNDTH